jgi:hypothetical protein
MIMLLDQATPAELQAASLLTGTTMVAFLAAGLVRGRGQMLRMALAGIYLAALLGFVIYAVL